MRYATFALTLLTAGLASAQEEFEVASVKLSGPESRGAPQEGGPGTSSPERMTFSRVSLVYLMSTAYEVGPDQIVGPNWLTQQWYDIQVKLPAGTTKRQANEMLQKLLTDRFRIVLHHESRPLTLYVLSVAPGGPKLKPTANPEAKPLRPGMFTQTDRDGFPEFPEGYGGMAGVISNGVWHRTYASISMEAVVRQLRNDLGQDIIPAHIVDESGLDGHYDFRLEYFVAEGLGPGGVQSKLGGGPELIQAFEKQAGLKLEKTKAPFDVLVIDSIQRMPTEN